MGYWKNSLAPEVFNFNDSLQKVYAAGLTGITDQEKLNMAVSMHIGKSKHTSYSEKCQSPLEWPGYLEDAGILLPSHPWLH